MKRYHSNRIMNSYETTADELIERIRKLIPANPHILEMQDAFDLFQVPGFDCDDLGPSLFQASWALSRAKELGPL